MGGPFVCSVSLAFVLMSAEDGLGSFRLKRKTMRNFENTCARIVEQLVYRGIHDARML
ncbi:hypothetical protein CEV33_3350 [Brucella grignonensis]|uniref:Uncharacterized protein n=1 Tax=Brucella grignonensis TaxID=94627 RepID=A0A256F120_9HYPH|nr:hypothetical protein CEV33_3350 [Brucella grignonensis]